MPILTALTISIGVLAGIATWLFVGPGASLGLQIWAAFIAWAAFYHSGGKTAALKSNLPAHILGVVVGWLALIGIFSFAASLGVPLAAGILVGIGAAVLVFAANVPTFASIPSSVYGFGCVAAYTLLAGKSATMMSASIVDNPLVNIVASMIIGALFGWLSESVGGALAKKSAVATA